MVIPTPEASVTTRTHVPLFRITYYNAVPAQTDSDPFTSACGPNLDAQVAVSRDLFRSALDCGDKVLVWVDGEYHGQFTVWDTMHPRFTNTLDILTETRFDWGRSHGYLVVVDSDRN